MRKTILTFAVCLAAMAVLASGSATYSDELGQGQGQGQGAQVFVVPLSGDQEVPPVETDAFGLAIFTVRPNQPAVHYLLMTSPMEDVTQAHIHFGQAGVNGPVVAWLYGEPGNIPPTPNAGMLASGVITADDLVGILEGEPISALIDLMVDAEAYVNLHTATFPAGELRGQIGPVGQ